MSARVRDCSLHTLGDAAGRICRLCLRDDPLAQGQLRRRRRRLRLRREPFGSGDVQLVAQTFELTLSGLGAEALMGTAGFEPIECEHVCPRVKGCVERAERSSMQRSVHFALEDTADRGVRRHEEQRRRSGAWRAAVTNRDGAQVRGAWRTAAA